MKQINNIIEEKYVSYKNAILLKFAGFDVPTIYPYVNGQIDFDRSDLLNDSELFIDYNHPDSLDIRGDDVIAAPTIQIVVDWIYKNWKISIESHLNIPQEGEQNGCYVWNGVIKSDENYKIKILHITENKSTSENAYQDAITYTLTNIINNE